MKNPIKTSHGVSITLLLMIMAISCMSGNEQDFIPPSFSEESIEVYFFHFTRKCSNCEAIKSVTASILEKNYPEEWERGELLFRLVNTETEKGRYIANDLHIVGQQVLIFKGDLVIELTQPAFLFAREDPDRYEAILTEELDKLL